MRLPVLFWLAFDPEPELSVGVALLGKRTPLTQRSRVVTTLVCLKALFEVLPPCRGGKRQEQQRGEDSFHARIERLAGGGVNDEVGRQFLYFRKR